MHRNKVELAKLYLTLATLHYRAWGAKAKVEDLRECYGGFISRRPIEELTEDLPIELLEISPKLSQDSFDLRSLQSGMTLRTSAGLDALCVPDEFKEADSGEFLYGSSSELFTSD